MNDQQGNTRETQAEQSAKPAEIRSTRIYYQHKEHGGLYEISTEDDGRIAIWPQGGGFQRSLSAEFFADQFVEAPALVMRRGTVTAEFLAEDVVLPCFSDGRVWNGWGMPRFDKETALKVVSLMPNPSYNEATGIITLQFVGEEPEDYTGLIQSPAKARRSKPTKLAAAGHGTASNFRQRKTRIRWARRPMKRVSCSCRPTFRTLLLIRQCR